MSTSLRCEFILIHFAQYTATLSTTVPIIKIPHFSSVPPILDPLTQHINHRVLHMPYGNSIQHIQQPEQYIIFYYYSGVVLIGRSVHMLLYLHFGHRLLRKYAQKCCISYQKWNTRQINAIWRYTSLISMISLKIMSLLLR